MNNEGGYANDPDDLGGETYKGIARVFHPKWAGWARVDEEKRARGGKLPNNYLIKDAGLDQLVHKFYKTTFWDAVGGDQIQHQPLAELLADAAVGGLVFALQMMQAVLRRAPFKMEVALDGKIGPQTLNAINKADGRRLLNEYKKPRAAYYHYRVGKLDTTSPWYSFFVTVGKRINTSQVKFFNSWMRRLNEWPDFVLEHKTEIGAGVKVVAALVVAFGLYKFNA